MTCFRGYILKIIAHKSAVNQLCTYSRPISVIFVYFSTFSSNNCVSPPNNSTWTSFFFILLITQNFSCVFEFNHFGPISEEKVMGNNAKIISCTHHVTILMWLWRVNCPDMHHQVARNWAKINLNWHFYGKQWPYLSKCHFDATWSNFLTIL